MINTTYFYPWTGIILENIMVMRNYYLTSLLVSENSPRKLVTGTCRQSLRKKGLRGEGYKQKERESEREK